MNILGPSKVNNRRKTSSGVETVKSYEIRRNDMKTVHYFSDLTTAIDKLARLKNR